MVHAGIGDKNDDMTHKHEWKAYGGCDSNPGCWDLGHGNMIFVKHCKVCDRVAVRGTNYAGQRGDWRHSFATPAEYLRHYHPEEWRRQQLSSR
jgi:hypothetical protein